MSVFINKRTVATTFIILLYTNIAQAANCITSEGLQQYLMTVAQNEADGQ